MEAPTGAQILVAKQLRQVPIKLSTLSQLKERRGELIAIAQRHGAYDLRVFGSVVRAEEGLESDIDFLVHRGEHVSRWFPAGLIQDLERTLGRPVDVVTDQGLNPLLREQVLSEAVPL